MKNPIRFRISAYILLAAVLGGLASIAHADGKAFVWTADDPNLEWAACPWGPAPEGCEVAVLQGNPEQPNADVLLKLPPNSEFAHHKHTSAERMVLLAGEFKVDYVGQDPVVMKPKKYAYGPARLPHTSYCLDAGECILFIAFEEPADVIAVSKN